MRSEKDMRRAIDDMTRQRRELHLLVLITGAATIALLVISASDLLKGPLPVVGAALTGMAAACAWTCSDVCRRAGTLLSDHGRKGEGSARHGPRG